MKLTSAQANKMLKQLDEEKTYWTTKEKSSCVYTAAQEEEPVIPDYDYTEVAGEIERIDKDMCRLKHAINLSNITSTVVVGGEEMTVDALLVRMAQLGKRKTRLDYMRQQQPTSRVEEYRKNAIEYQHINFDLDLIKKEFKDVSELIADMQLALDKHNQTYEFEVDI